MPKTREEHVIVEVWQNQRRFPVFGWSEDKLLPTDRYQWSSEDGTKEQRQDDPSVIPASHEFRAGYDWRVDVPPNNTTDTDGWSYAFDFPRTYSAEEGFHSWVRRRRWIRVAFKSADSHDDADEAPAATRSGAMDDDDVVAEEEPVASDEPVATAASPSAAVAPPAETAPPKPPVKTEEERVLEAWNRVRGSRCGSVVVRAAYPVLYKEAPIKLRIVQTTHEFISVKEFTKPGLNHTDASFEVCFLIADDKDPITISPMHGEHPLGEACFSLRAGKAIADTFEQIVNGGAYTETGTAQLALYPSPHRGTSEERALQQLGRIDVSWSFTLRDADEFHACGDMSVADTGDEAALDAMISSMSRLQHGVNSPLRPPAANGTTGDTTMLEGPGVSAPSDAHQDKRGRLIIRVNQGEGLHSTIEKRLSPYVKFRFTNTNFVEACERTQHESGAEPNYSRTFVLDIGDFSKGVEVELWDHVTFGSDKIVARAPPLTPEFVEEHSRGSSVVMLPFRDSASEVPKPSGSLLCCVSWIPFTL